jgi:hypothetical protein
MCFDERPDDRADRHWRIGIDYLAGNMGLRPDVALAGFHLLTAIDTVNALGLDPMERYRVTEVRQVLPSAALAPFEAVLARAADPLRTIQRRLVRVHQLRRVDSDGARARGELRAISQVIRDLCRSPAGNGGVEQATDLLLREVSRLVEEMEYELERDSRRTEQLRRALLHRAQLRRMGANRGRAHILRRVGDGGEAVCSVWGDLTALVGMRRVDRRVELRNEVLEALVAGLQLLTSET